MEWESATDSGGLNVKRRKVLSDRIVQRQTRYAGPLRQPQDGRAFRHLFQFQRLLSHSLSQTNPLLFNAITKFDSKLSRVRDDEQVCYY